MQYILTILNNYRNLAGTRVSIERDISNARKEDKRVMLLLKKDIQAKDTSQHLLVRDDRLRVGTKWFQWNADKELTCGQQSGADALTGIYGNCIRNLDLSYYNFYNRLNRNERNN